MNSDHPLLVEPNGKMTTGRKILVCLVLAGSLAASLLYASLLIKDARTPAAPALGRPGGRRP